MSEQTKTETKAEEKARAAANEALHERVAADQPESVRGKRALAPHETPNPDGLPATEYTPGGVAYRGPVDPTATTFVDPTDDDKR